MKAYSCSSFVQEIRLYSQFTHNVYAHLFILPGSAYTYKYILYRQ